MYAGESTLYTIYSCAMRCDAMRSSRVQKGLTESERKETRSDIRKTMRLMRRVAASSDLTLATCKIFNWPMSAMFLFVDCASCGYSYSYCVRFWCCAETTVRVYMLDTGGVSTATYSYTGINSNTN